MLARPELLGEAARLTPGIANWSNRQPLFRVLMEHTLGVHREKLLPEFHGETFMDWYRKQPAIAGDASRAIFFVTCSVNYNNPQIGKDAMAVYARNGIALIGGETELLRDARAWRPGTSNSPGAWRGPTWTPCCLTSGPARRS